MEIRRMKTSHKILEVSIMDQMLMMIVDIILNRHLIGILLLGLHKMDKDYNIKGHNKTQNISEVRLMCNTNTMVIWE